MWLSMNKSPKTLCSADFFFKAMEKKGAGE
jgi:hypothetical protein